MIRRFPDVYKRQTLERAEIIRDLRLDVFDVLVGINLLLSLIHI